MIILLMGVGLFFWMKGKENEGPPLQAEITTSIENDAVRGNKETAKVAIVEFSDYECPYCIGFTQGTSKELIEKYVETGKVIMVFRDLPLPFHEPSASREAMAAECARDQGGDEKFFEMHDAIFDGTTGNGAGLSLENLGGLANKMGLKGTELINCINENRFEDEVRADAMDASKVGINGTPGFVVGVLSENGEVRGEVISGAQPLTVFEAVIAKYL